MKILILALLVSASLCAKMTPSTSLPLVFDDMIFNNMDTAPLLADAAPSKVGNEISAEIKIDDITALKAFLTLKAPSWIAPKSVEHILASVKNVKESNIDSHYVFKATPQDSSFRYAMINVVPVKAGAVKLAVSVMNSRAVGVLKPYYYHDVQTSAHGLPFQTIKILIGKLKNRNNESFHDRNKQKLLKALETVRGTRKAVLKNTGLGQVTFTGVLDAINAVASAWKAVANAFKTVNRETFLYMTKGEGFTSYSAKSKLLRSIGIDLNRWQDYRTNYMIVTGMDENPVLKNIAETTLDLAEFMPDNQLYMNDHVFDIKKTGETNTVVAMSKADLSIMKAFVITVTTTGSYKLAPNVYVFEKFKSVAGGIYQEKKEIRKEVPRSLNDEDIKALHAMSILSAINIMTKNFGISFKLPSDDPLKLN